MRRKSRACNLHAQKIVIYASYGGGHKEGVCACVGETYVGTATVNASPGGRSRCDFKAFQQWTGSVVHLQTLWIGCHFRAGQSDNAARHASNQAPSRSMLEAPTEGALLAACQCMSPSSPLIVLPQPDPATEAASSWPSLSPTQN